MAHAIAHAAETSENAEVFLTRVARGMASDLERSDYREGCPIATTALETAAQSEVLGVATRNAFKLWEHEIKSGLERFGMKTVRDLKLSSAGDRALFTELRKSFTFQSRPVCITARFGFDLRQGRQYFACARYFEVKQSFVRG